MKKIMRIGEKVVKENKLAEKRQNEYEKLCRKEASEERLESLRLLREDEELERSALEEELKSRTKCVGTIGFFNGAMCTIKEVLELTHKMFLVEFCKEVVPKELTARHEHFIPKDVFNKYPVGTTGTYHGNLYDHSCKVVHHMICDGFLEVEVYTNHGTSRRKIHITDFEQKNFTIIDDDISHNLYEANMGRV